MIIFTGMLVQTLMVSSMLHVGLGSKLQQIIAPLWWASSWAAEFDEMMNRNS